MIKRPMLLLLMLSVIAITYPGSACGGEQSAPGADSWPKVAGLRETYHFSSAEEAAVDLVLLGEDGKELYALQCHNYLYEEDPAFDYSGDFECCLKSIYTWEPFSTLFTENPDQDADWESRARFFCYSLAGNCAEYPDYGAKRDFRLRGMHIILEISSITFSKSYIEVDSSEVVSIRLKSFTFQITVKSDPDANTGITEPSIYAEPPIVNPGTNNESTCDCSKVKLKTDK